jgi:hypothetical protein
MQISPANSSSSDIDDICLLLRAHGEHRWLTGELAPVIDELEHGGVADEQVGAALAYLELLWLDGRQRACETDAAYARLDGELARDRVLYEKARRYHAAVRRERTAFARRVAALTGRVRVDGSAEHAHG